MMLITSFVLTVLLFSLIGMLAFQAFINWWRDSRKTKYYEARYKND